MAEITLEQLQTAQNNFINQRTAEINTLKENTAEALSNLSQLANKVYSYNHQSFAVKSLETYYDEIKTADTELSELSAVGFTAILKDGETVPVQGNRLFINGAEETQDYIFNGSNSSTGTEYVNVWYFEKNSSLNLNFHPQFEPLEVIIRQKLTVPELSFEFLNYLSSLTLDKFSNDAGRTAVKKFTNKSPSSMGGDNSTPVNCQEIVIKPSDNNLNYRICGGKVIPSVCKKIVIDCETISFAPGGGYPMLGYASNSFNPSNAWYGTLELKNVKSISGYSNGVYSSTFENISRIEVPESVTSLSDPYIFGNIQYLKLNCKNATYIHNSFAAGIQNFELCSDWGASINLSGVCSGWNKAQFIELFTHKLRDMEEDVREIKIPSGIYDSLTDEEFAIAEDKGWTIGA